MRELLADFVIDETAATKTDFSLLVAGIGLAIASIAFQVGPKSSEIVGRMIEMISG
jgi:Flp pilus assembly pilin Flp